MYKRQVLKYAVRPWSSGHCLGRMYTNHVRWSDRAPEVKQAWAPHERGIRLFTPLVDGRAKRGVAAKNTGYFILAFLSRICSKNMHECATLYLVNEIEFGNSDAGVVIPTPKLPSPESFRSIRALFKPGDISVPLPALCVFANSPTDIDEPR